MLLSPGGTAGGVAAGITTPLDVIKTRLQLQGVHSPQRYSTSAMVNFVPPSFGCPQLCVARIVRARSVACPYACVQ